MSFDYDLNFSGCAATTHNLSNGPVDEFAIVVYDRQDGSAPRIDFDANPAHYSREEVDAHQQRFMGDSALPDGPISGGSLATSSVIPAVFKAADQAIASLLIIAVTTPGSPFLGHKPDDLALEAGRVFVKAEGAARGVAFADLLKGANVRLVSGSAEMTAFAPNQKFSKHSFGCHFVEAPGSRKPRACALAAS
jgi:CO/xanthine dehydrogenase Mo-binding subunit